MALFASLDPRQHPDELRPVVFVDHEYRAMLLLERLQPRALARHAVIKTKQRRTAHVGAQIAIISERDVKH